MDFEFVFLLWLLDWFVWVKLILFENINIRKY